MQVLYVDFSINSKAHIVLYILYTQKDRKGGQLVKKSSGESVI